MITANIIPDITKFYLDTNFQFVDLTDSNKIEKEFLRLLHWNKNAFWDKMSIKLLKELDGSERMGDFGVNTTIGYSCITCLATGYKLALIIFFYKENQPKAKILTSLHCTGENVWKYLSNNIDTELYLYEKQICSYELYNLFEVKFNGEVTEFSKLIKYIADRKCLTKAREESAYNEYIDYTGAEKCKTRDIFEKMSLYDFLLSLNKEYMDSVLEDCRENEYYYPYTMEQIEDWKKYTVINYCSRIDNYYNGYRAYLVTEEDDKNVVTYTYGISGSLEDFILDDILEKTENNFLYVAIYETDLETADKYIDAVRFGIYVDNESKKIIIFDKFHAVEEFHRLVQLPDTIIERNENL